VDHEVAERLVRRGRELGAERGVVVTVAVVDAAGHPVALARGKNWHGPYMALGKARLAAAFRKPTDALLDGWADRPLFAESLTTVLPGGVTLNPGGHPVVRDGECIGAVGVGGGPPELDAEIARLTAEDPSDSPEPSEPSELRSSDRHIRSQERNFGVVVTDGAPEPTGPFHQGVRVPAGAGLVFTAGQAGRNRDTGEMGDAAEQVDWALRNLDAILRAGGSSLAAAVKLTLYVRDDVTDMAPLNEAYRRHFPGDLPARSTVFVSRLKGPDMLVEIEAVGVAG
jgi:2-iminobutanoate/2-iminopropanoate deaminase